MTCREAPDGRRGAAAGRVAASRAPERHRAAMLAARAAALAPGSAPPAPGLAGLLAGLWSGTLRFDAADPRWPDRDRFVVSDGELAPLHHALLELCGVTGAGELAERRHPFPALHPAVEAAAGLPGQGFAAATGLALAERVMAARFGRSLVDHRTWVLASARELAAGVGQEAASLAGELGLDRLAVIFVEPASAATGDETELARRFAACGWSVRRVDGEDPDAVASCLAAVERARKPTLIACAPGRAAPPAPAPDHDDAAALWRASGEAGAPRRRAWLKRLARHARRAEFEGAHEAQVGRAWMRLLGEHRSRCAGTDAATLDTTVSVLAAVATLDPAGGRRLLHLSSTRASAAFAHLPPVIRGAYDGRHLDCDGREHAMTMLAIGLALHGGTMPVAACPTVAADRIRPALRLAALTGCHLVQLLTEDGLSARAGDPMLQPLEQLASLRAIPGLLVFRPGCAVEAAECLELALRHADGPSVILLSAVAQAAVRADAGGNAVARGGYLVADAASGVRAATLIASGSELGAALAARALLAARGIESAVVSLPCWELFARQSVEYRAGVLGTAPRFGIEAACGFGWERWLGEAGRFIGLDGFGASGRDRRTPHPSRRGGRGRSAARDLRARDRRELARRAADGRAGACAHDRRPTRVISQSGGDALGVANSERCNERGRISGWPSRLRSMGSAGSAAWCSARSCESGRDDVVPVAINDLGSVEANAHLFRYDSVHGRFPGEVIVEGDSITIHTHAGKTYGPIKVSAERDPSKVPYQGVDVAMECTGLFTSKESASPLLITAGARKVLVSAPADGVDATSCSA